MRLDTAIPAKHLLSMYQRRGFTTIGEAQWEGKTYRSCIMEKVLNVSPARQDAATSDHTQPSLRIRDASMGDASILARLATQLSYANTAEAIKTRIASLATDTEKVQVAEIDGVPVAFQHLRLIRSFVSPHYLEIAALVVEEGLRGGGIGKALVDAAEDWASSLGLSFLFKPRI